MAGKAWKSHAVTSVGEVVGPRLEGVRRTRESMAEEDANLPTTYCQGLMRGKNGHRHILGPMVSKSDPIHRSG
jgi:hypothetical protein